MLNLTDDEIKNAKESFSKIQFENDDETQKKNIENIFRIANKNSVEWASLFVYCYEQLMNLKHPKIKARLEELHEVYAKINSDLEEYNRGIEYGRHYIYNSLRRTIEGNILAVREIVDFAFTRILYEGSDEMEEES